MNWRHYFWCMVVCAAVLSGCGLLHGSKKHVKLTIEMRVDQFIRNMANDPEDARLNKALVGAVSAERSSSRPFAVLFDSVFEQQNPGFQLAKLFVKPSQSEIGSGSSNDVVVAVLSHQARDAMARTYRTLEARILVIDKNAKVTVDSKTGVITADLKTNYTPDRLHAYVGSDGDIEFFETYANGEFASFLTAVNDTLAAMRYGPSVFDEPAADDEPARPQGEGDTASLADITLHHNKSDSERQREKYPLFSLLSPNVQKDQLVNGPVVGFAKASDVDALKQVFSESRIRALLPPDAHIAFSKPDAKDSVNRVVYVYVIKMPAGGEPIIDGRSIVSARADYSPVNGKPTINVEMSHAGARKWAQMTQQNINHYIALVVNGYVCSCPRVDAAITNGSTEISGTFTTEEAVDLAHMLSSGRLPMPLRVTQTDLEE